MWTMGIYIKSALESVLYNILPRKFNKEVSYFKKPLSEQTKEYEDLTEEEICKKEIEKAILIENQWVADLENSSLPKIKLK